MFKLGHLLRLILFLTLSVATQFSFTLSTWQTMAIMTVYIILYFYWEFSVWDKNKEKFKNDFILELERHGIEPVHMDCEMWVKCYISINKDFKSIAAYDSEKNFGLFHPNEIISCELDLFARSQHRAGSAIVTIQLDGSFVTELVLEFVEHSAPSKLCELVKKVMDNKTAVATS